MIFADGAAARTHLDTLDSEARRAVVAEIARAMRDEYVEPDAGVRAAESIQQALASGAYDSFQQPGAFASRLTDDLFGIVQDKHLKVIAWVGPVPAGAWAVRAAVNDFGVVRADRLVGNVGYLEVCGFVRSAKARAPLDRAMAALADTRGLIIDLRRHGGGSRHGVAYLLSFFLDCATPVPVSELLWREPGTTGYRSESTFTCRTPTSYLGKPVYILTSARTVSGGEMFSYDMRAMQLATLVGETTRGGANPPRPGPMLQVGTGIALALPCGKARSPITGGNWERVGVAPDIAVASEAALKVALEKLGEAPLAIGIGDLSQASLFQVRAAPLPGSEVALRHLIAGMAAGQPDYEQMTSAFAGAVRNELAAARATLAALGVMKSATFVGPEMSGDRFEVRFANGVQIGSLFLSPKGKVALSFFRPITAVS